LIVNLLGLGSPSHPLPVESYRAWASTYKCKKIYDIEFLYVGPPVSPSVITCVD
jgi:hypothetical protein